MTNNFRQSRKSKKNSRMNLLNFGYKSLVISDQFIFPRQGQAPRLRSTKLAAGRSQLRQGFAGQAGQAALSLVFLIGGIALLVSVTLAVIAISFLNSTFAFQSANRAYANATSGAQDALLKLVRNESYSNLAGYSVPKDCTANCATVTINQVDPNKQVEIVSTATVFSSTRKIKVLASIDQNNGEVHVSSWENIEF